MFAQNSLTTTRADFVFVGPHDEGEQLPTAPSGEETSFNTWFGFSFDVAGFEVASGPSVQPAA